MLNYSIDYLENDPRLLSFIAKNLSSGVFNISDEETASVKALNYCETCLEMLSKDRDDYLNPELMLYTIFELINATCYGCILYNKPVPMKEYKPYLQRAINAIMVSFTKSYATSQNYE